MGDPLDTIVASCMLTRHGRLHIYILFDLIWVAVASRCNKVRNVASLEESPAPTFLLDYTDVMAYYSIIWNKLLTARIARETSLAVRNYSSSGTLIFPDLSEIRGNRTQPRRSDRDRSQFPVNDILASFATNGPLLPRLILTGALASPIVSVFLQRDTVDIGGNQGLLSIGGLPAGIAVEDLTWVPLRLYTAAEGGFPAPEDFPNEVLLNAHLLPA
jgi:hypothetical protein